jgi:hypothetical protein
MVEPGIVHDDARELTGWVTREGTALPAVERLALRRAADAFRSELRRECTAFARDFGFASELALAERAPLSELYDAIERRFATSTDSLGMRRGLQHLADARAGLVPARPRERDTPTDRWLSIDGSLDDRLRHAVETELGPARTRELFTGEWAEGDEVSMFEGQCPVPE